jgi:hypothetical protein
VLANPGFNIVLTKRCRRSSGRNLRCLTATKIRFMCDINFTPIPKRNGAMMDLAERVRVNQTYQGRVHRIRAELEVVLSLGAINTPKVLMQSGVGDQTELHRFGFPLVEHLPGVGQNYQDHVALPGMIWECCGEEPNAAFHWFWKSDSSLDTPDLQTTQAPLETTGLKKVIPTLPASGWMMLPACHTDQEPGSRSSYGAGFPRPRRH